MPLIRNSNLPTFDRLLSEGRSVLDVERATHQDIRELHIGFLNLMPDAALEAAERQYFRLIGESNRIVQIHVHPFTLPVIQRGPDALAYIEKYYEPFEKIKESGLDALIITGASEESNPLVTDQTHWQPLIEAMDWAYHNVTSTLCSCLASHAVLTYRYGQQPEWRTDKRFGVFQHRVVDCSHPLVMGCNTLFFLPHARHSELRREQFESAGWPILVDSVDGGVHMAVSPDGFRFIAMQGHPEYDTFSLLKEYRREVNLYIEGKRPDYPSFPHGYFRPDIAEKVLQFQQDAESGKNKEPFPEDDFINTLDNTWADSARSIMASWVGLVYQITHVDRKKPFMDGIDPNAPLKSLLQR